MLNLFLHKSELYQTNYTNNPFYFLPRKLYKNDLPFSCFLCFRLLQIFTAHIDKIMATIKNKRPPTTPAVIALCLTRAGTGNFTSSLDS